MSEKLITIQQLCEIFQVSRSTVDRWRKAGLPCLKIGRNIRFNEEVAINWIKNINHNKAIETQKNCN